MQVDVSEYDWLEGRVSQVGTALKNKEALSRQLSLSGRSAATGL